MKLVSIDLYLKCFYDATGSLADGNALEEKLRIKIYFV
jgi:hypothetical protein